MCQSYWAKKEEVIMTEARWQQHLYSEEDFSKLCELSKNFNDDINSNNPVRPENETFTQFMDKGSEALIRDHKNLLEYLL